MIARASIKAAAEWTLVRGGAPIVARFMHRDATIVLTYHGIVSAPDIARGGEASLHIDRQTFGDQLDRLAETHEIVPLRDLWSAPEGRRGRPRAIITFDDAYTGALTLGVDELAKRGVPATFFVAPAFTSGRSFWWDGIAARHDGVIPTEVRRAALVECSGADDLVRDWADISRIPMDEPPAELRCATLADLRAAARVSGISFGSHSWSHPVLSRLSSNDLARELEWPLRWLHRQFDEVLPVLAVPYGYSSAVVESEAQRLGYTALFPGHSGWVSVNDPLSRSLPRQSVPAGLSPRGFTLRGAGLKA